MAWPILILLPAVMVLGLALVVSRREARRGMGASSSIAEN
jgi:hypothetical protein